MILCSLLMFQTSSSLVGCFIQRIILLTLPPVLTSIAFVILVSVLAQTGYHQRVKTTAFKIQLQTKSFLSKHYYPIASRSQAYFTLSPVEAAQLCMPRD